MRKFNPLINTAAVVLATSVLLSACGGGSGGADPAAANGFVLPPGISVVPANPVAPGGQVVGTGAGLVATTQGSTLIRTAPQPAGAQCAASGTRVDSGIDVNGNGLLDAAEVAATAFVCNGVPGANGANGADGATGAVGPAGAVGLAGVVGSAGAVGPAGVAGSAGAVGPTGVAGSAGAVGPAGVAGSAGAAGPAGLNGAAGLPGAAGTAGAQGSAGATGLATLMLISPEPIGTNCAAGGVKVQAGSDADRNGVLAVPGEVSTTSFVCNGIDGTNGAGSTGKNWQNAARIESGIPPVSINASPQVVFDGLGKALAVWQSSDNNIVASNYAAAVWSVPQKINTVSTGLKFNFAMNEQGVAVAVWLQTLPASGKVEAWSSRRTGEGVWLPPLRINEGTTNDALDIVVAINLDGYAHAVWYEKAADGKISVKARHYSAFVNSWFSVTTLQADIAGVSGQVYGLSLAMDNTQAAVAAYTRDTGSSIVVETNRYNKDTGLWGIAVPAGGLTCLIRLCSAPRLLMNNIGQTLLVWAANNLPGNSGGRRTIYAARYSGGAWEDAVGLSSGDFNVTGEALMPDAAMDSVGNAVAMWTEQVAGATRSAVYTSRLTVPAVGTPRWGASELLSGTGLRVSNPKVTLDASGNAQAVWTQEDAAQVSSTWSSRFSASTAWGAATRIHTQPLGDALSPQVAVDPATGTVLSVWFIRALGGGPNGIWTNFFR